MVRRTALAMLLVIVAALVGVVLPGTGTAATSVATGTVAADKHSHDPGHGGPSHSPPPKPTATGTTDPPASAPDSPAPSAAPTGTTPGDAAQPPVPTPAPPASATTAAGAGSQAGSQQAGMVGRRLGPASGSPEAAPPGVHRLDPAASVTLAGTAVPLWLIVGGGALLVIIVCVGLVLTLRDRDGGNQSISQSTGRTYE